MILEHNNEASILHDFSGEYIYTSRTLQSAHSILVNELGYRSVNGVGNFSKGVYINNKNLSENYEAVENLKIIDFDRTKVKLLAYHQCYQSKKGKYFIIIDKDLSVDWEDDFITSDDKVRVTGIYYDTHSPFSILIATEEFNEFMSSNPDNSSKISIVLKTPQGYEFKQRQIKPLDINIASMYNEDFLPVYDHVVDSLTKGKKGIVLFHGKAGTGKTNLVKYLTTQIPDKNFVFIPVSMIPSLTDPSFLGQLMDNKNSILVLEDCENYLKDRGQTENSVVSAILNLSDGILSDILGIQIIATFNADLTKVDEALLRKGRLIDEYDFKELSVDKCQALVDSFGIDQTITEPMTLAEIFNIEDTASRVQLNKRKQIGFGK